MGVLAVDSWRVRRLAGSQELNDCSGIPPPYDWAGRSTGNVVVSVNHPEEDIG